MDLSEVYNQKRYYVRQERFQKNLGYQFDIDATNADEVLLKKIERQSASLYDLFEYSRGVEISKTGQVTKCPLCGAIQTCSSNMIEKKCISCDAPFSIGKDNRHSIVFDTNQQDSLPMFVGENIQRYATKGNRFIRTGVPGIKYKMPKIYLGGKFLIRKTGLGINATIDPTSTMVSQTVHILRMKVHDDDELYYYLGVVNSRLIYYYYLKKHGEIEWKSHPYLTKEIIFSLPLCRYEKSSLSEKISRLSRKLSMEYERQVDLELERLIEQLYHITPDEKQIMVKCINTMPDLSAINNMKYPE